MTIEIDYIGEHDLYAKVCRTPRGKLYIHLLDEQSDVHGENTDKIPIDETMLISDRDITEVDC